MRFISRGIVQHARLLAREISARAVLIYGDVLVRDDELVRVLRSINFPTIVVTRSTDPPPAVPICDECTFVTVPDVHMTRTGQVKIAVLNCLAQGNLVNGDRVVCLSGVGGTDLIDTLIVLDLGRETELFSNPGNFSLGGDVRFEVFERAVNLAAQLAAEGREGRAIGLVFVLGDSEKVLAQCRQLVLNPFHGYPEVARNILDPALEDTIKEYSALDGAFVVRGDGVILAAAAHLVPDVRPISLPMGLGTRHAAAAAITGSSDAVALVISQSTGTVSVLKSGEIITRIDRRTNGGAVTPDNYSKMSLVG